MTDRGGNYAGLHPERVRRQTSARRKQIARPLVYLSSVATLIPSVLASAAEPPRVRIEIVRHAETGSCPDDDTLRREISAHLGSDPFDSTAPTRVRVEVSRIDHRYVAELTRAGADGETTGSQTLDSTDCTELFAAAAATLAIVIGPPPSPPTSPPAPLLPEPPERARGPSDHVDAKAAPLSPRRPGLRIALGVLGALGTAPAPALGFTLEAGLRFRLFSLAIEGRADLPAGKELDGGSRVSSSLLLASLVPCGRVSPFSLCAIGSAGVLRGSAYRDGATPFGALGARVGWEHGFGRFDVGLHADLLATLTRTTLRADGADVWSTPPILGALGVSFGSTL